MNTVSITGNLTKDPELKELETTKVCELRVASATRRGKAVYVDVSTFGAQAEACVKYLAKGRQIAVSGELVLDEWESGGQRRSKLYIVAGSVDFLDRKPESEPKRKVGRPKKAAAAQ
jgi:single-strand DNA-binding protein